MTQPSSSQSSSDYVHLADRDVVVTRVVITEEMVDAAARVIHGGARGADICHGCVSTAERALKAALEVAAKTGTGPSDG